MSRNDSASITLNFTSPQEVIKEYFEGLAKVEAVKHASKSNEYRFDWGSLLSLAVPFILPHLAETLNGKSKSSDVRVPTKKPFESNDNIDVKDNTDVIQVVSTNDQVMLKMLQEQGIEIAGRGKINDEEETPDKKEEIDDAEIPLVLTMLFNEYNIVDANDRKILKGLFGKYLPEKEKSSNKKINISTGSDEKKSDVPVSTKPRRPIYQDGEVTLDLNNLQNAFSGTNGTNGIADMMKNFAPLMEGLMNGMNTMKPNDSSKASSTENISVNESSKKSTKAEVENKDSVEVKSEVIDVKETL
jgi:hypothetical protein